MERLKASDLAYPAASARLDKAEEFLSDFGFVRPKRMGDTLYINPPQLWTREEGYRAQWGPRAPAMFTPTRRREQDLKKS